MNLKRIIAAAIIMLFALFLGVLLGSIFVSRTANSDPQQIRALLSGPPRPGDFGYRHDELHPFYQKVFSSGKCSCSSGECRPTRARASRKSPVGVEVLINRVWCPVSTEALITQEDKKSIPAELRVDEAHVCAGELTDSHGCPVEQECVIINDSQ